MTIKNASVYESVYDLMHDYREYFPFTSEDVEKAISFCDENEPYNYLVLNNETVLVFDCFGGSVLESFSLDDFGKFTVDFVIKELL